MVAPAQPVSTEITELTSLPIPPSESLEEWVGYICYAMLENALSEGQRAAVMTYIRKDPDAWQVYREFFSLEAAMLEYFRAPEKSDQPELATAMASPIW